MVLYRFDENAMIRTCDPRGSFKDNKIDLNVNVEFCWKDNDEKRLGESETHRIL